MRRTIVQWVWLVLASTYYYHYVPFCKVSAAAAGIFGRRGGSKSNGSQGQPPVLAADSPSSDLPPKPPLLPPPRIPVLLPPMHHQTSTALDGNPPISQIYSALPSPSDEASGNRLLPPTQFTHDAFDANQSDDVPVDSTSPLATAQPASRNENDRDLPPPPPPLPQWQLQQQQQTETGNSFTRPSIGSSWFDAPPEQPDPFSPPQHDLRHHSQPQQLQQPMYDEQLYFMQRDLEEAYRREQELRDELNNATAWSSGRQQREILHMHQLDVLTERVLQVETSAATDRLHLLEYQSNCTGLSLQLSESEELALEWQTKCEALLQQRIADEAQIAASQEKLKAATNKVEDLAAMIEHHRLWQESATKEKKPRRGFWAWLFGFGKSNDEDDEDESDNGSKTVSSGSSTSMELYIHNPKYKQMQEIARSTLLTALSTERNNVNELELALTTSQQNNSAIAEQVQSRDQIIDELNNRIAVFEEDKLVLKAALRQLQMEMKDEAPKVQQLADDLADAEKEADRLMDEMDAFTQSHRTEISKLERIIEEKQEAIKSAESNLTVIGTYVDKLEERLADFTVARRDIEGRELAYTEAESKAKEALGQRDSLKQRVHELEQEHDDLKQLLAELAQERGKLQNDNAALGLERSALQKDVHSLRQSYAKLDNEAKGLRENSGDKRSMLDQLQKDLNETMATNNRLLQELNATGVELLQLRNASDIARASEIEQGILLRQTTAMHQSLQHRISELESERQTATQTQRLLTEDSQRKLEAMRRELKQARESEMKAVNETKQALAKVESESSTAIDEPNISLAMKNKTGSTTSESHGENSNVTAATKSQQTGSGENGFGVVPGGSGVQIQQQDTAPPPRQGFGSGLVNRTNATVVTNVTLGAPNQTSTRRNVPFRSVRKLFARATGLHGLFTKPSTPNFKRKPNVSGKPPATSVPNKVAVAPPSLPNEVKHTMWGMKYHKPKAGERDGRT